MMHHIAISNERDSFTNSKVLAYRFVCSCGTVGPWEPEPYLAQCDADAHRRRVAVQEA